MVSIAMTFMGAFIVLLYLGVIPWQPRARCRAVFCDPYHWQVLCFGLVFLLAGLSFLIPARLRVLRVLSSVMLITLFFGAFIGTFFAR